MWYCYTIRLHDRFRHLSLIADTLQEIYNFISDITKIDTNSFAFEIVSVSALKTL